MVLCPAGGEAFRAATTDGNGRDVRCCGGRVTVTVEATYPLP
jgi:hypothetical protein